MENKKNEIIDNLFVYATKSDDVAEEVTKIVSEKHSTMEIMRLDSRLLEDIEKGFSKENNNRTSLEEFLSNEDNRKNAEEKALTLWNIITNNADLGLSKDKIFTKTEIVKRTTLSHKKLNNLIELLSLFGFVEVVEKIKLRFIFDENVRQASILADIVIELQRLGGQIERYKLLHSKDKQESVINDLRNTVGKILFKDNEGEF